MKVFECQDHWDCCSAETSVHIRLNGFLCPCELSESLLHPPPLAGRVITLVVVPGVLVTIVAILGLLERKNE